MMDTFPPVQGYNHELIVWKVNLIWYTWVTKTLFTHMYQKMFGHLIQKVLCSTYMLFNVSWWKKHDIIQNLNLYVKSQKIQCPA